MSTVKKALDLLSLFSNTRPEIGLTQFCRLAKRDKATTFRYLQALESSGFVEQNPLTKHYRLGPAILQLAQTRETTVPRKSGATFALQQLADATGETTHVSVLSGTTVFPLTSCESPKHGTRVIIDIQTFPLHATASGICVLAFGPNDLINVAEDNLRSFTPTTVTNIDDLGLAIQEAKQTGFGKANGSFEEDVRSLAAPIFDPTGLIAGSVSVACVASRFTPALEHIIKTNLITASRQITHNWGGTVPASLEHAWEQTLSNSHTLEITS